MLQLQRTNVIIDMKALLKNLYRTVKWPFLPNGIYCFNYHRIGDEKHSKFDPNVFSCTATQFEQHIIFFKKNFTVISVEELIDKIDKNQIIDRKYALITFDDGYIDNYNTAYPILKKHQIPAAFYIATDYLDNPHIPWWDEIAWIIRHTKASSVKLKNWTTAVDISSSNITQNVRSILRAVKLDKTRTMTDKITELEQVCQCKMSEEAHKTSLFINWQQAKEMVENGMHIGSHTLSHSILSHLTVLEQQHELSLSKEKIEQHLGIETTSIAYPVGGVDAFTKQTQTIAKQQGYKIAFSFIPGITMAFSESNKYQLPRLPVDENCTVSQLKNIIVRNI
jgi:peptidoglycan/xylan/chitin deacetylase (PgdA/CDA1 family)